MKTINLLLIALFFISSCRTNKELPGIYTIEKNPEVGIQLTLNKDRSFVEYVEPRECAPKWYFGFYELEGRRVELNLVSEKLNHLRKQDTIIYNETALIKDRRIYIYFNESKPFDIADVFAQGDRFLGKADKDGLLIIPGNIVLDSLIIKSSIFHKRAFKIQDRKYNQLFIMVYDYTFEECADWHFKARFKRSNSRLFYLMNSESGRKPGKVFLFKNK